MPSRDIQLRAWLSQLAHTPSLNLKAMTNDASFRRYYRAQWADNSYVVMDAPPDKENLAAFIDIAHRLRQAGLNAPDILASHSEAGFLLLTDLGDDLYLPTLQAHDADQVERLYGDALSALATLQVCVPCTDLPRYDKALLHREMDLLPDWLLAQHLSLHLTEHQHEQLQSCFQQLSAMALSQPQVFVHRDYHSRNLLICGHNPGIIDFQDAVCGAVTYDLVSLLRDAYIVWPREKVEDWVLGYHQLALQTGIIKDISEQTFLHWFDWMGLQRHIKVAGIFARLCHRDHKPAYLADIPRVLQYIVEVAEQYSEMQFLSDLIQQHILPKFVKM